MDQGASALQPRSFDPSARSSDKRPQGIIAIVSNISQVEPKHNTSQQMQRKSFDTYTLIMPCSAAARRLFPPYAVIGFCGPNRLSPTDTTCVIPILFNMRALPACSLQSVRPPHRHASTLTHMLPK